MEEDELVKRILAHYDKDKYSSVNNFLKQTVLELYAIDKQAAFSKEDLTDIIRQAYNIPEGNIVSGRYEEEINDILSKNEGNNIFMY